MLVRIYSDIIDIPNDSVLFIVITDTAIDHNPKIYPVRIYLRNGETKDGFMVEQSLNIHSQLILNVKQFEVIQKIIDEKVRGNDKYQKRNKSLFRLLKKIL